MATLTDLQILSKLLKVDLNTLSGDDKLFCKNMIHGGLMLTKKQRIRCLRILKEVENEE